MPWSSRRLRTQRNCLRLIDGLERKKLAQLGAKAYLKQLLKKRNFNLHTYRLNFSNSTLQVFLSLDKKTITNEKKHKFATKKTELLNKIESRNIPKIIQSGLVAAVSG